MPGSAISVTQPDGSAEQFVRGFASCPDAGHGPPSSPSGNGPPPAPSPQPEFRLTTVVPGVAVSIEIGGFTRW